MLNRHITNEIRHPNAICVSNSTRRECVLQCFLHSVSFITHNVQVKVLLHVFLLSLPGFFILYFDSIFNQQARICDFIKLQTNFNL